MRNDINRWDRALTIDYQGPGLSVREVASSGLQYVSGTNVLSHFQLQLVEWPSFAPKDQFALVLRRDRVLFVGQSGLSCGYHHTTGLAVSDISSKYISLEIIGPDSQKHLSALCDLRLERPSRSVVRKFFDHPVAVYRFGEQDQFRLLINRAAAPGFTKRLMAESAARAPG